jgi:3-hydroxymyristoyl/3-hydroxydecanoyl-(acyl carrier protein) dehydratase
MPAATRMHWLSNLPHQIPFRAASAVRRIDEKTIEGVYLCTANDLLSTGVMVVEAMAQFAGGLVFREQGFFTGIDRCELSRQIEVGDVVVCTVTLEADFGGTYRFSGTGQVDGLEVVKGRFYLSAHAQS